MWNLPLEFNFTRDVVEPLARDRTRRALTFVDREGVVTRHTFADLARDAARWAGLLRGHRLEPGAVVMVAAGPTPAWPAIVLGALKAGLVVAPVEPEVSPGELARRALAARVALVVAEPAAAATIEDMQARLERPLATVYVDEIAALLRDQPMSAPTHPTVPRDPAFILTRSAARGEARLVRHTNAHVWAQRLTGEHWLGAGDDDLVWNTAGTGSAAAVWHSLLGPWSRGAEIVLHEGDFDADERLNLVEQLRVTVLCQTPEEYRRLAELEGIEGCDLRALRQAVSHGERPDPAAAARWLAAFGIVLRNGYEQTETGLVLGTPAGTVAAAGAMGTPLPGYDLAVVAAGEELEPGEEGELVLRGRPPSLFAGYVGERSPPASVRGDWYLTGDRAVKDESGLYWVTGRAEDVITGHGHSVGALEVEAALLGHPAVADAAAVQAGGGERRGAKAYVVAAPGAEPDDELADALREHARHAAGVRAVPAEIEFVSELPRTPAWKLDRAELRRREQERPSEAAAAAWPQPARLVVPQPRTLDVEPEPAAPETMPDVGAGKPVELHAVPEPESAPELEAEPEAAPESVTEPEPDPEPVPEPEPPEPKPVPPPAPIQAPSAGGGLAARLAAYGHRPEHGEDDKT